MEWLEGTPHQPPSREAGKLALGLWGRRESLGGSEWLQGLALIGWVGVAHGGCHCFWEVFALAKRPCGPQTDSIGE